MPRVQLVCQFGEPVRGLSPYADALLKALSGCEGLQVEPVDYRSAYPSAMHPAGGVGSVDRGELHWADPGTWYRVARRDADIVHIQHWMAPLATYLLPLASMSRRAGKRVAITVHNPRPHESLSIFDALERQLLCAADVLIVHDENGARALRQRLGRRRCDIRVIPHGISAANREGRQASDYARVGLDPDRRYVICFGNLREYKGLDILLDAWRQVVDQVPDADLIIAGRLWTGGKGGLARVSVWLMGSGRHAEKIMARLDSPDLSQRVIFREGFVSDDDVDTLLRVSEMAVFPYEKFSSQSGAACRAAGSGCPVLVSDVGGLPDLAISGEWVLEPGSLDGLTRALQDRLSFGKVRDVFGARQIDRIEPYAWDHVAQMHASAYRDMLEIDA